MEANHFSGLGRKVAARQSIQGCDDEEEAQVQEERCIFKRSDEEGKSTTAQNSRLLPVPKASETSQAMKLSRTPKRSEPSLTDSATMRIRSATKKANCDGELEVRDAGDFENAVSGQGNGPRTRQEPGEVSYDRSPKRAGLFEVEPPGILSWREQFYEHTSHIPFREDYLISRKSLLNRPAVSSPDSVFSPSQDGRRVDALLRKDTGYDASAEDRPAAPVSVGLLIIHT
ncbi:uncharacterized protein MYCGRDRAFT_97751 [Zymoseptoria tritici IPO323]|uniref:Uncharacterized protein n=1 Tax=Zymoseptoria tritici (strain CBS 115943 / IPO323) TaxID=336722 RepID=F9XR92_ZYMTI|nr:uncharacterized protein MYCGRDRAFT_97751 [Zymoseptoria tritici IPO323]EGP82218.1 hypothetical protein MYCGRDRAFT_97751 [Zymoseptoria tritici IPO323]